MTHSVHLPLLEQREVELSTCGYCPKLCRAVCPVSDARPTEAVTPWGKMTSAWEAARGAALTSERAELAWACSGCFRCREACDHKNSVAETLSDARADYVARGLAPESIRLLLERREVVEASHASAVVDLAFQPGVDQASKTALLIGCRYVRDLAEVAGDAIRVATKLLGPVRLLGGCCGAWHYAAGDRAASASAHARSLAEAAGSARLVVVDAGCALHMRQQGKNIQTLIEIAARNPAAFRASAPTEPVRYHDACALGRGLELYAEPRRALEFALGRAPDEFGLTRERARCSGGGALLPLTMPDVAEHAAEKRLSEHSALGGGKLVTGCASSLSMFLAKGADALDVTQVLAQSLVDHG
jgi:Fe-S oxidoreductase